MTVMVTRPVVDGHNDLPWAMRKVGYDFSARDIAQPQPELHTDLGRLRAVGVAGQFWSVFVPCSYRGADAVTATLEQIDAVHSMVSHYPHALALVTSAEGLQLTAEQGVGGGTVDPRRRRGSHGTKTSPGDQSKDRLTSPHRTLVPGERFCSLSGREACAAIPVARCG